VLSRCVREAGYTPPTRALGDLVGALDDVGDAERAPLERAIARAGAAALKVVLGALPRTAPEQRPSLFALLVRLAGEAQDEVDHAALLEALLGGLRESFSGSRKAAARALGKLGDPSAESELLLVLPALPPVEQKSVVDALALLGGQASLAALALFAAGDADGLRRRERALLLIERRLGRPGSGVVVFDRPLGTATRVLLACRAGLSEILAAELTDLGPRVRSPSAVELDHAGTLSALLVARTAQEVGLLVPLDDSIADPVERIAEVLTRPDTLARVARWTDGTARFRISWSDGGHHRARAWAVAQRVRRHSEQFLNDSQQAPWTAHVRSDASGELWLTPRLDPDPRFLYRVSQVPAASHPTIAAALARLAGVQDDEIVWDPFVGSAQELVERARLGPVRELWGSDIDPRALSAARANLDAAGLREAQLIEGSALEVGPERASLMITNPPMGRRLSRDRGLAPLLEGLVRRAARVLRPGGRLVWLSPLDAKTERVARAAGLGVTLGSHVDIGGFSARLQIFTRPH
jgi:23S rRNA G2445 N2-methylase RlmL